MAYFHDINDEEEEKKKKPSQIASSTSKGYFYDIEKDEPVKQQLEVQEAPVKEDVQVANQQPVQEEKNFFQKAVGTIKKAVLGEDIEGDKRTTWERIQEELIGIESKGGKKNREEVQQYYDNLKTGKEKADTAQELQDLAKIKAYEKLRDEADIMSAQKQEGQAKNYIEVEDYDSNDPEVKAYIKKHPFATVGQIKEKFADKNIKKYYEQDVASGKRVEISKEEYEKGRGKSADYGNLQDIYAGIRILEAEIGIRYESKGAVPEAIKNLDAGIAMGMVDYQQWTPVISSEALEVGSKAIKKASEEGWDSLSEREQTEAMIYYASVVESDNQAEMSLMDKVLRIPAHGLGWGFGMTGSASLTGMGSVPDPTTLSTGLVKVIQTAGVEALRAIGLSSVLDDNTNKKYLELTTPEYAYFVDKTGDMIIEKLQEAKYSEQEEGFGIISKDNKAKQMAELSNFLEIYSESWGKILGVAGDEFLNSLVKTKVLANFANWARRTGKLFDGTVNQFLKTGRFDSVLGEFLEEELLEPVQSSIERRDYEGANTKEGRERMLIEFLGFGMTGAGAMIQGYAQNRDKKKVINFVNNNKEKFGIEEGKALDTQGNLYDEKTGEIIVPKEEVFKEPVKDDVFVETVVDKTDAFKELEEDITKAEEEIGKEEVGVEVGQETIQPTEVPVEKETTVVSETKEITRLVEEIDVDLDILYKEAQELNDAQAQYSYMIEDKDAETLYEKYGSGKATDLDQKKQELVEIVSSYSKRIGDLETERDASEYASPIPQISKEVLDGETPQRQDQLTRVSQVYREVLNNKNLSDRIDDTTWVLQRREEIENPERFSKIEEIENNKGIKIGDRIRTKEGEEVLVTSIYKQDRPVDKGRVSVSYASSQNYGGWNYIEDVEKIESTKPKTQKEVVKEVLSKKGKPMTIKEVAETTKILEPNIRRILGVGAKTGEFERVADGVYVLKTESGQVAYIQSGNALEILPELVEDGFKADMVFLDIPYKTPAVTGGNRGMKYSFVTPDEFGQVLDSVNKILRSENSPVIYMFSQAKSGWKKMQEYNNMLDKKGLKVIAKGDWQKRFANGDKVTNVRGAIAQPEGILLLSQSGKIYKDIVPIDLNFDFVRPKGYQSEKNAEMIKQMIELTTDYGDVVLDPFAGSGVVPAEAIKAGRSAVAIEVEKQVVEEVIKPRVQKAVKEAPKKEEAVHISEATGMSDEKKLEFLNNTAQDNWKMNFDKLTPARQLQALMEIAPLGEGYIRTTDTDILTKLGKGVGTLSLSDTAVGDKQEIFLWGGEREGLYTDGMILFTDKPVVKKIINKFQEQFFTKYSKQLKGLRSEFTKERINSMAFPETQPILDSAKANFKLEPIGFYVNDTNKQTGSVIFRAENGTLVRISGKYYSAIKSFYPTAQFYITDESNVKPISFVVGKTRKGIVMPMMMTDDTSFKNLVGKELLKESEEAVKSKEQKEEETKLIKSAERFTREDMMDDMINHLWEHVENETPIERMASTGGTIGYSGEGEWKYDNKTGMITVSMVDGRTEKISMKEARDYVKAYLDRKYKKAEDDLPFRQQTGKRQVLNSDKLNNVSKEQLLRVNREIFGDEKIEILERIMTPDAQQAMGRYLNRWVQIRSGSANKGSTYYHEAVHKALDIFLTPSEKALLIKEVRKIKGDEYLRKEFGKLTSKEKTRLTSYANNAVDSFMRYQEQIARVSMGVKELVKTDEWKGREIILNSYARDFGIEPENLWGSVVQVYDTTLNKKVFYLVDGKIDAVHAFALIDNTEFGLAGETFDGKRYHLTSLSKEHFDNPNVIIEGVFNPSLLPYSKDLSQQGKQREYRIQFGITKGGNGKFRGAVSEDITLDMMAEEWLAENIIDHINTKTPTTFVGKLKRMVELFVDRWFKTMDNINTIGDLYEGLLSGRLLERQRRLDRQQVKAFDKYLKSVSASGLRTDAVYRTEVAKEVKKLTTKILKKLEGKTSVKKQFISDLAKQQDIKQVEKDIINQVLKKFPDDIDVATFEQKVLANLLPLERAKLYNPRYEMIALPYEMRGEIDDYYEVIYRSPFDVEAGKTHFGFSMGDYFDAVDEKLLKREDAISDKYFGHVRVDEVDKDSIRRVIEVQSDLYQKGTLDKERERVSGYPTSSKQLSLLKGIEQLDTQYNDPTAHMRMVREEIKDASEDNIKTILFPVGDTAMIIEGLAGRGNKNFLHYEDSTDLKPSDLVRGQKFNDRRNRGQRFNNFIVLEKTGKETFKAIALSYDAPEILQESNDGDFSEEYLSFLDKYVKENQSLVEEFSIAEEIDKSNPIYKFYEDTLGKYLKNNYQAELFTDERDVSWWKVDIKPEYAGAVEAFRLDELVDYGKVAKNINKFDRAEFYRKSKQYVEDITKGKTELMGLMSTYKTKQEFLDNMLFHGSSEGAFDGKFTGGGYDGVFIWTTDSPKTAQNYIPTIGGMSFFSFRSNLDDVISPSRFNDNKALQELFGLKFENVKWDSSGREAESWRNLNPVTEREAMNKLKKLGYTFDKWGGIEQGLIEVDGKIQKPDYKETSELYIFSGKQNLNLKDIRVAEEGDLMDVDYNKFDEFKKAKEEGYDGVIINDFGQSDLMGNYNHTSFGLFEKGYKKLKQTKVPAQNFDEWNTYKGELTPELDALWSEAHNDTAKYRVEEPAEVTVPLPELLSIATELGTDVSLSRRMTKNLGVFKHPKGLAQGVDETAIKLNALLFEPQGELVTNMKGEEERLPETPEQQMNRIHAIERTLAHEIGHFWDWFGGEGNLTLLRGKLVGRIGNLISYMNNEYKGYEDADIRAELKTLTQIWKPFNENIDEDYTKYRYKGVELYADAISVLLNNPQLLKQTAPKFYQGFVEFLARKKEVKAEFFAIVDSIKEGGNIQARLDKMDEGYKSATGVRMSIDQRKEEMKKQRKWENVMSKIKYAIADQHAPYLDKLRKLQKEGGIERSKLQESEMLMDEMEFIGDKQGMYARDVQDNFFDPISEAGIDVDDIGKIMELERNLGDRIDLANPQGLQYDYAKETYEELKNKFTPAKWAVLQDRLNWFREFNFDLVTKGYEAGVYSRKFYTEIAQVNKNTYTPFAVIQYITDNYVTAGIIQARGTTKQVENPINTQMLKSLDLIRLTTTNLAKTNIVKTLQENFSEEIQQADAVKGADGYVRSFKRDAELEDRGYKQLELLVDGKRTAFYVDGFIKSSFDRLLDDSTAEVVRLIFTPIRIFNRVFKPLVTTFKPSFQFYSNPIKDVKDSLNNLSALSAYLDQDNRGVALRTGRVYKAFLKEWIGSLKQSWDYSGGKLDKVTEKLLKYHAISGQIKYEDIELGTDEIKFDAVKNRVVHKGKVNWADSIIEWTGQKAILKKTIYPLLKTYQRLGQTIEVNSKVAGFKFLQDEYYLGDKEAGLYTRKYVGTPNFMQKGKLTSITNEIQPFSNVQIQAFMRSTELATTPKTASGYWFSMFFSTVLPKLVMLAGATLLKVPIPDPEDEDKTIWVNPFDYMSEYDKSNYICVPIGYDPITKKWLYLRIPMSESEQVIGNAVWKMGRVLQGEGIKVEQLAVSVFSQIPFLGLIAGSNDNPFTEILGGWIDYVQGRNPYDDFRGRPAILTSKWNEGGATRFTEMVKWSTNTIGATNFVTYDKDLDTTLEHVLQAPILERMFRLSDYGITEKEQWEKDMGKKEKNKQLDTVLQKYYSEPSDKNLLKYQDEYVKAVKGEAPDGGWSGTEKAEETRLKQEFKREVLAQSGSEFTKIAKSGLSNKDKENILDSKRKQLSEEEFTDFVTQAVRYEVVKGEMFAEYAKKANLSDQQVYKVVKQSIPVLSAESNNTLLWELRKVDMISDRSLINLRNAGLLTSAGYAKYKQVTAKWYEDRYSKDEQEDSRDSLF